MPRVGIVFPGGLTIEIATRDEQLLRAWFDEVLPHAWATVGQEIVYPRANIWPMWAWKDGPPSGPDWLTDSRVLGRLITFPASDGKSGMYELARIKAELSAELAQMDAGKKPGERR